MMPKLDQRAVATTTAEIILEPRLAKQLRARLDNYHTLKKDLDSVQAALDDEKAAIAKLREKSGYQRVQLDGFTVTEVCGVKHTLDKKKLVALGCAVGVVARGHHYYPQAPLHSGDRAGGEGEQ
jgi:hypothetical protein